MHPLHGLFGRRVPLDTQNVLWYFFSYQAYHLPLLTHCVFQSLRKRFRAESDSPLVFVQMRSNCWNCR